MKRFLSLNDQLTATDATAIKKAKQRLRLKKFGITQVEYEQFLESQGYVCAVCKLPPQEGKVFAIDHDHKTGKVRGLLHRNCNVGIGMLSENITYLENAIAYLKKYQ
jgi:hypothetical protein